MADRVAETLDQLRREVGYIEELTRLRTLVATARRCRLTQRQFALLHELVRAWPKPVTTADLAYAYIHDFGTRETLPARSGITKRDYSAVRTGIFLLRTKFERYGVAIEIATDRNSGGYTVSFGKDVRKLA